MYNIGMFHFFLARRLYYQRHNCTIFHIILTVYISYKHNIASVHIFANWNDEIYIYIHMYACIYLSTCFIYKSLHNINKNSQCEHIQRLNITRKTLYK